MSLFKFFINPFAVSGDTTAVPDDLQPTGTVSYEEGYPPNYSKDKDTDPSYLPIEREKFNQLMNDVTGNIRQWQTLSVPYYITSAQNGGVAYSYSKYARVRYDDAGTEKVYESLIDNNTDFPTVSTSWIQVIGSSVTYGSGWVQVGDKLIQFGSSTNTGAATTVTLPVSYSDAGYNVFITPFLGISLAGNYIMGYPSLTRTSSTFSWGASGAASGVVPSVNSTAGSVIVNWITIGDA